MYSTNRIIRTISLTGAFAFVTLSPTVRAVDPPPDGGYPNGNTAEGEDALFSLTTGEANTASGFQTLFNNTTGNSNTANGWHALYDNTDGFANTASGVSALENNTIGSNNTATGNNALSFNTTGIWNTGTGFGALLLNSTGNNNTATGFDALFSNTTGGNNTATGVNALYSNTTGQGNTAIGISALLTNRAGSGNIALGESAGINLTGGDRNIDIGNKGVAGDGKTIRLGTNGTHKATFIAGISGVAVAGGVGVMINPNGQLGTVVSSERFKSEIRPMDKASEAILSLRPVTFRYKHELDPAGIPQFGLVAEQVEKVNPDLVAKDEQGKTYTVRYEAVNAMLLNEFLKEHRRVEKLEASLTRLEATVEAQAAQIQKVSDCLKTQAPAPRIVANQ